MRLVEEVPLDDTYRQVDRCGFQYGYRSIIGFDDEEKRRLDLEQTLLSLMDRQAAAYCMAAINAAIMGENRRCRDEFLDEDPLPLNADGDWGYPDPV